MHIFLPVAAATVAFIVALPTHASPVDGSKTRLVINLASHHINYTPTKKYPHLNEFNPGLGLEQEFSDQWSVSGGFYRNSYYANTVYAGASWMPLARPIGGGSMRSGIFANIATGYEETNRGRSIMPMAGLRFAWRPNSTPVGFDVLVMAREAKTIRAVLGFQLSYQLQ